MAITEFSTLGQTISRVGNNAPALGCGHFKVAAAGTHTGNFVAVQVIDGTVDTILSGIVGDSGTGLTLPKEMVGDIVYMNFTAITTTRDILVYHRCNGQA